jgi:hypothetical protein
MGANMDDDKSTFEKVADTVKGAVGTVVDGAKSILTPTSETPIDMPHNESAADIRKVAKKRKSTARASARLPRKQKLAVKKNRAKAKSTKKSPAKKSAKKTPTVKKAKKKKASR